MSTRPRRTGASRSAKKKKKRSVPSAAHFVGYVEDEESPAMIMKKFEKLEQIQKQLADAAAAADGDEEEEEEQQQQQRRKSGKGEAEEEDEEEEEQKKGSSSKNMALSEEHLEKLFQSTSNFSVDHIMKESVERVYKFGDTYIQGDLAEALFESDNDYYHSSDDDFFDDSNANKARRRRRARKRQKSKSTASKKRTRKKSASKKAASKKPRKKSSSSRSGRPIRTHTYSMMQQRRTRKASSVQDPLKPEYIRIPPLPLPRSWGMPLFRMETAIPDEKLPCSKVVETQILDCDLLSLNPDPCYQGILFDPPWRDPNGPTDQPGTITVDQFSTLKISDKLMSKGLLFIWVHKPLISDVLSCVKAWGFKYVENLVWVRKNIDNTIHQTPFPIFNTSKGTLLVCRKETKTPLEIRHQRTPDVVFDFVVNNEIKREKRPEAIYRMIEIILPNAKANPETGKGLFLELWAPSRNARRVGWTTVINKE